MLVVSNIEHMRKCLDFAARKQQLPQLLERLWFLHTYACGVDSAAIPVLSEAELESFPACWQAVDASTTVCRLYVDFAPASFGFTISKRGELWFGGGLIYHGNQAGWALADGSEIPAGYGVETFSVELTRNATDNPWSVHT